MHRFYCPDTDLSAKTVAITDKDELHHLRDVLRLKKDTDVVLFDGRGKEAAGKLLSVTPQKAQVAPLSVRQTRPKKPSFILACALPKKSKFEMIIEKATELGADEIIPLMTRRTEIHLNNERSAKKQLRYRTVAVNAAKQSQRLFIPVIHPVTRFPEALEHLTHTTDALIPSLPGTPRNMLDVLREISSSKAVSFLIGPEGDFTNEEYAQAAQAGCIPVTLGETVLKVETAAICVLSCANLFFRA